MVQYATAAELAAHLGHDVDLAKADQILEVASARFSKAADTWFDAVSETYTREGNGSRVLCLPHKPITAVSSVEINDVAVTDYTRINSTLYRMAGFGACTFPPDKVEVAYTHGYTDVPDDVKGAVLDMAGSAYEIAASLTSEQIDDYSVRYSDGGGEVVALTMGAEELAAHYRGVFVA